MSRRGGVSRLSLAMVLALAATPVVAQEAAPAAQAPVTQAQPQTPTVTVTATAPGYRSTIDSKSYGLTNDLQNATGSVGDVLRNLPAVQVGSDGDVSLRGDPNVTILVDGKPSALFSGPGRAQAIQSLPAGQYERVEVMTNPPAGVTAEGGGVINLITKKSKGSATPTFNGTLKADAGVGDRFDLGATGVYTAQGFSFSGSANFRRGAFSRAIETRYGLPDPATGALDPADGVQKQGQRDDDVTVNGAIGYDLGPRDHLDASVNVESYRGTLGQLATYQTGVATGPLALDYLSSGYSNDTFESTSEQLGLTHTFPGEGHSLSAQVSLSQGRYADHYPTAYAYLFPVQPAAYQDLGVNESFPQLDLKLDYKVTLPNKARLALGYEGRFDWQREESNGAQGVSAATAVPDPTVAQSFRFNQEVHALYATYEQSFGKLTVQPGVRLENTTLDTNLITTGERGRQAYLKAYPSFHLDYALDDNNTLKASYSERVQRPDEDRLDPFHLEVSLTRYNAGTPTLKPAITQSWEVGYEYRKQSTDFQATLFYRDKSNIFTQEAQDIGGDVLLYTWRNIGHSQDTGLELVANRELLRNLTLNVSTDLTESEVDASNLGLAQKRSDFIVSARATLNWQVGKNDFLQLGGQSSGRQLTAQGYYGGAIFSDLGWRHRFDNRLALVLTAQNPFGLSRRTIATDTPDLVSLQKRKYNNSAVFLGLTYAFGGGLKRAADNFDFGGQKPGGS